MEEFIPISKIVALVEPVPNKLTVGLKKQYIEYLSEDITGEIIQAGFLSEAHDLDSCDLSEVIDYVGDRVLELDVTFEKSEIEQISKSCDLDDIIQSNMDAAMNAVNEDMESEAYKEQEGVATVGIDPISDLFDRS
ncbi:MAG: hypothetical protein KAJ63_04995 [Methyloprofundus sp.]|nr:hypothetical protein [Methyloprofundus sp.]